MIGQTDAQGGGRSLAICIDATVKFIDTANVYPDAPAEASLDKAIARRRGEILLAT